jgi:hypothetical protein
LPLLLRKFNFISFLSYQKQQSINKDSLREITPALKTSKVLQLTGHAQKIHPVVISPRDSVDFGIFPPLPIPQLHSEDFDDTGLFRMKYEACAIGYGGIGRYVQYS